MRRLLFWFPVEKYHIPAQEVPLALRFFSHMDNGDSVGQSPIDNLMKTNVSQKLQQRIRQRKHSYAFGQQCVRLTGPH
jgi:hypothetical protein